jgi:hypothetical protein
MTMPDTLPPPTSLDESFSSLSFGRKGEPSKGGDVAKVRVSVDGDEDDRRSLPDTGRDPEGALNSVGWSPSVIRF